MSRSFSAKEAEILRMAQGQLPDTLTPYADMARAAGVSENHVLELLISLKRDGAIRRFGASLRHQRTGWTHNVMVAWKASEEEADTCSRKIGAMRNISHAYYRPSPGPSWPYSFYTMIHGRSAAECRQVVDSILAIWPHAEYMMLPTLRELKKTSMTYF